MNGVKVFLLWAAAWAVTSASGLLFYALFHAVVSS